MSRYINPYTDFGFKKLFGEEASKDLFIDFLNTLLPDKHQIKTLDFHNPEQLGASASDRRSIFDIYCENAKGGKQSITNGTWRRARRRYCWLRSIICRSN